MRKSNQKQIAFNIDGDLKREFDIALKARRDFIQPLLCNYIARYVEDTRELQEQGLIKLL